MNRLSQTSMLVRVMVSDWSAKTSDKSATIEFLDGKGADKRMGNFRKTLLRSNNLDQYRSTVAKVRDLHSTLTLPWLDNGYRILPTSLHMDYATKMKTLIGRAEHWADAFEQEYDDAVARAKVELGKLFNASNYPKAETVRKRFRIKIQSCPVPDNSDWRIKIGKNEMDLIKAEMEDGMKEAQGAAIADLLERMDDVVSNIANSLSGSDRVYAGMFDKVKELVSIVPNLNIYGDKAVDSLIRDIAKSLSNVDPEDLRGGDKQSDRDSVADEAARIMATINAARGVPAKVKTKKKTSKK